MLDPLDGSHRNNSICCNLRHQIAFSPAHTLYHPFLIFYLEAGKTFDGWHFMKNEWCRIINCLQKLIWLLVFHQARTKLVLTFWQFNYLQSRILILSMSVTSTVALMLIKLHFGKTMARYTELCATTIIFLLALNNSFAVSVGRHLSSHLFIFAY